LESIISIILINVFIFIGLNLNESFLRFFALSPSSVWSQPWTLVTSMFTHVHFTHILFNMWALYFFGNAIIRILGTRRFWLIYMVGGIIGSLVFVAIGERNSLVIGASGAVFALGGALAVLKPQMKVIFFPIPVALPLWVGIAASFTIITLLAIFNILPSIAWQSHLGGVALGALAGWIFKRSTRNNFA